MRALAFVIFAACAGAPTVPAAPAAPHYRTVHIDTLAPDKAAQFEGARRAWVAELHSHGASDQRGRFFEVVGVGFLTIRPFSKFADLDARGASRKAALANVPADALARYDKLSDESLAFPHASEVWEPDTDFAFGSLDETTAGAIEMIVEDVRPDTASEAAYLAAWNETKRALVDAHYPLSRVTFRPVYGSGRLVTMWLAKSRAELEAAPRPLDVVAKLRGDDRAKELAAALDGTVLRREVHAVIPRPDLSSP
jgi:hypothetical protein